MNAEKTEAILFTSITKRPTHIQIRGKSIALSPHVKYLGLTIDRKLLSKTHIRQTIAKAKILLSRLFILLRARTLSLQVRLRIYFSVIRPTLTYACPLWHNTAPCHFNLLQIVQNKCVPLISDSPRFTPLNSLHEDRSIPDLRTFINTITSRFNTSLQKHPEESLHLLNTFMLSKWSIRCRRT